MTRLKICGLTSADNALACVEEGADAIGINLWPKSKRAATPPQAEAIFRAVGVAARIVFVFVDAERAELEACRARFGDGVWLQLHGEEPPGLVRALGPRVLKALRGTPDVESQSRAYPMGELLIDAAVAGLPGGTGVTADWSLARRVAQERPVWLAGGIRPENAAEAIEEVQPLGLDVASGVESAPGMKDLDRVRALVKAMGRR